jgi:hypothetical protein
MITHAYPRKTVPDRWEFAARTSLGLLRSDFRQLWRNRNGGHAWVRHALRALLPILRRRKADVAREEGAAV